MLIITIIKPLLSKPVPTFIFNVRDFSPDAQPPSSGGSGTGFGSAASGGAEGTVRRSRLRQMQLSARDLLPETRGLPVTRQRESLRRPPREN